MKKLFKSISLLLALVLALSVVPTMNAEAASKVKLNKTSVTLEKGKTTTLKVTGTKKKVTWSSNNTNVATVNKKGKVTAKKKGTATITAKVSGKKYTCKVTVKDKANGKFPYKTNKIYRDGKEEYYYLKSLETDSIYEPFILWKTKGSFKYYAKNIAQSDYIGTYGGVEYFKKYLIGVNYNGKKTYTLNNKPKSKCPYKTYKVYDKGGINVYFYYTTDISAESAYKAKSKGKYNSCQRDVSEIFDERYGGEDEICGERDYASEYVGTYGGQKYYRAFSSYVKDMKGKVVAQYIYKDSLQ